MNDLSSALGDLLPAALGIAISPLPIIASVLMLLSNHPKRAAPAFAVRTWRGRPEEGEETVPPKWMASLDDIGPGAALALGAALSGLNPKNLALAVSGSVAIASADLDTATTVVCVIAPWSRAPCSHASSPPRR